MIVFLPDHLRDIVGACEIAYPKEACGLLVGTVEGDGTARVIRVARIEASENLAPSGEEHFEIDPSLRLKLQKELRETSEKVIGLYHSHPNASPQPSATDLESAWEPDLAWLIVSVRDGQGVQLGGYIIETDDVQSSFIEIPVRTSDWGELPAGPPIKGSGLEF